MLGRVGSNSIFCVFCKHWMHKMCSSLEGRLRSVPVYKCMKCTGEIRPLEGLPEEYVAVSNESLEVVNKFCCLGDIISAAGGVEQSIV